MTITSFRKLLAEHIEFRDASTNIQERFINFVRSGLEAYLVDSLSKSQFLHKLRHLHAIARTHQLEVGPMLNARSTFAEIGEDVWYIWAELLEEGVL